MGRCFCWEFSERVVSVVFCVSCLVDWRARWSVVVIVCFVLLFFCRLMVYCVFCFRVC